MVLEIMGETGNFLKCHGLLSTKNGLDEDVRKLLAESFGQIVGLWEILSRILSRRSKIYIRVFF